MPRCGRPRSQEARHRQEQRLPLAGRPAALIWASPGRDHVVLGLGEFDLQHAVNAHRMRNLQVWPISPAPRPRTRQRIGETVQRATEAKHRSHVGRLPQMCKPSRAVPHMLKLDHDHGGSRLRQGAARLSLRMPASSIALAGATRSPIGNPPMVGEQGTASLSGGVLCRCRRLPVLGQDGDQPPWRGTDGQRSAASRQRDAPAVLTEMLGLAKRIWLSREPYSPHSIGRLNTA